MARLVRYSDSPASPVYSITLRTERAKLNRPLAVCALPVLANFRVSDRGSGNPTPLGGMGLDLAQALLGSAFAGETLSGVGSGNATEEVWAGWIKNQTPQKPDDDFKVT